MSEEVVLFRGSPSLMVKARTFFIGILLIIGFAAGGSLTPWHFLWIGAAVVILFLVGVAVRIRAQVFEVTSERLKWQRGILTKRTDELELYRVMDATLVEPFLLRLAGAGNIEIRSADVTTPRLILPAVKGARELREKLRVCIEECRSRKGVRVTEFDHGQDAATPQGS